MSHRRRAVRFLGAAAVVASLTLTLSPAVAGASHASTPKGSVMCFLSGTLTANPPLTLGSGKATTLSLTASMHGCTSTKVTGGTLTGHSTDTSASCVGFENALPPLSGTISYKTTSGKVSKTTLSFSGGTLNSMEMPLNISYPKHGGTGSAKGSYANKKASMVLDLSGTYQQWVSACQSSSGLATMTVTQTSSLTA